MTDDKSGSDSMTDDLRDRIAEAIAAALDSDQASASGYGSEYVRNEGDGILKLDGDFNVFALADAVIRELPTAYVVTSGSYSDYQVRRVYLTREEAEQFVELRGTIRGYDELKIEEFPIGAGCAEYDGPGYEASWSITHDGTESEHLRELWLTGSYMRPVEKRGIQHNYRRFVVVEGIDRDQVLKVLRDAATQGRAEYEGLSSNFTFRMNDD